jgi:cobalt-zinc-cadmium efflux system membrane fusion protein
MKNSGKVIGLVAIALGAGTIYWLWRGPDALEVASPQAPATASVRTSSDTLRFDVNAPQLTFLRIESAPSAPVPMAEPFNARIAYDDNRTARVFSPVAGRVVKIVVEAGQEVKAGDPLLWLDAPDYAQAIADAAKADTDLRNKKEVFERAQQVYAAQGISRKEVQAAEADWHAADAEAQRARARLKNLGSADPAAGGRFVLRAPVDGRVSERKVNAGSEVQVDAADPLFVITDPSHLWVLVDLPERQLGTMQVGQPISIEVDAYPDASFSGTVAVVGGALDAVTRRVQVLCNVENPAPYKLLPQMFARVTPAMTSEEALPRVPNTAVFTQGLYSYLFVEQAPGVLQRRRITPDRQGTEYTWIREGLQAGDRIVTTGALLLNTELDGD